MCIFPFIFPLFKDGGGWGMRLPHWLLSPALGLDTVMMSLLECVEHSFPALILLIHQCKHYVRTVDCLMLWVCLFFSWTFYINTLPLAILGVLVQYNLPYHLRLPVARKTVTISNMHHFPQNTDLCWSLLFSTVLFSPIALHTKFCAAAESSHYQWGLDSSPTCCSPNSGSDYDLVSLIILADNSLFWGIWGF